MSDTNRTLEALWDDGGLFDEISDERKRQIEKGYTHEHDDEHGVEHLLGWSIAHTRSARNIEDRAGYIKAIALLVSAVEAHDRKEQNGVG